MSGWDLPAGHEPACQQAQGKWGAVCNCAAIRAAREGAGKAAWREGVAADIAALDLRAQFEAEGRTRWSEADPSGAVTIHEVDQ